jgi:hypothetical protein
VGDNTSLRLAGAEGELEGPEVAEVQGENPATTDRAGDGREPMGTEGTRRCDTPALRTGHAQ